MRSQPRRRAALLTRQFCCCLLAGWIGVLSGCGPERTGSLVQGTVTYAGQPLQQGALLFNPTDSEKPVARAEIRPDGSYELIAEPGEYKVIVTSFATDPPTIAPDHPDYVRPTSTIPKQYGALQTTPLQQVVPANDTVIDFHL